MKISDTEMFWEPLLIQNRNQGVTAPGELYMPYRCTVQPDEYRTHVLLTAARAHWKCPGVSPAVCDHWPPSLRLLPRPVSVRDECVRNSVSWLGTMLRVQWLVITGWVGAEHEAAHIQPPCITYRTFVYLHKAYIIVQRRSIYSTAADWLADKCFLMHSSTLWFMSKENRTRFSCGKKWTCLTSAAQCCCTILIESTDCTVLFETCNLTVCEQTVAKIGLVLRPT